jgi:hypothetical protein
MVRTGKITEKTFRLTGVGDNIQKARAYILYAESSIQIRQVTYTQISLIEYNYFLRAQRQIMGVLASPRIPDPIESAECFPPLLPPLISTTQ